MQYFMYHAKQRDMDSQVKLVRLNLTLIYLLQLDLTSGSECLNVSDIN